MHTATYCPEDNKLRLYPDWSDPDFDKEVVKAAGFRWASKQECYVCPRWTPKAEDVLLDLVDEIEDEDYSPEERAADRAERFAGYRDKRRGEAGDYADRFEAGPSAFGHQSQARAERQAARHDRLRGHAVTRWSKAEYWQQRTAGVIGHALHKSSAKVRRSRILTLESELRKHQNQIKAVVSKFKAWQHVLTLPDCDVADTSCAAGNPCLTYTIQGGRGGLIGYDYEKADSASLLAFTLVNYGHSRYDYKHPRKDRESSLYSLMTDETDPITPREAAEMFLSRCKDPETPGSYSERWTRHYELRLTYEKAMLENEGGMAGDVEMEVGGFFEGEQIHKINKSPATGRVVSVQVMTSKGKLRSRNVERCGQDDYRAPTDEEREAFKEFKAAKPKAPSLINPTIEDAQRLQELWNDWAKKNKPNVTTREVEEMTQKQYTGLSKHEAATTIGVAASGKRVSGWDKDPEPVAFKVRLRHRYWDSVDSIVVLTDKPQKPLPLDWEALEEKTVSAGQLF